MAVWVKVPVPGQEEAYYWSPETQATRWRAPESVEVVWVAKSTQAAATGNSKTIYFWNQKTREVTREPPASTKCPATWCTSAAPSPLSAPCPALGGSRPTAQHFLSEVDLQYSGPEYDSGNATSMQPPFQEPDDSAGCRGDAGQGRGGAGYRPLLLHAASGLGMLERKGRQALALVHGAARK